MDDLFTFCAVFLILLINIFLASLVLNVHSTISHQLPLILERDTVYTSVSDNSYSFWCEFIWNSICLHFVQRVTLNADSFPKTLVSLLLSSNALRLADLCLQQSTPSLLPHIPALKILIDIPTACPHLENEVIPTVCPLWRERLDVNCISKPPSWWNIDEDCRGRVRGWKKTYPDDPPAKESIK